MAFYPSFIESDSKVSQIINSEIFGNRFHGDQTLYEYLIEFLLVFVSYKDSDHSKGSLQFHDPNSNDLSYYVQPRMGLKRFIFFEKSKKGSAIKADEEAITFLYNKLESLISDSDEKKKKEIVEGLQDLLRGYGVVVRKRSWCAQAVLPICPELVFCEAMPNEKIRRGVNFQTNPEQVDTTFQFDQRNFLARGGEVYYLHLLQGLQEQPEKRQKLEFLLQNLIADQSKSLSSIANLIQSTWEDAIGLSEAGKFHKLKLSFIPASAYRGVEALSIEEIITYLSSKLDPINRIEVFAKGMMLQIMRMMNNAVSVYLDSQPIKWIVDMGGSSDGIVRKVAADGFRRIEDAFINAINKRAQEMNLSQADSLKKTRDARTDSLDIFKSKGKEIQCIIPTKGPQTRFTLSEDVIRFLVLSLVKPGEKMTYSFFLEKLYEHYGIVIGADQYRKSLNQNEGQKESWVSSFNENSRAFQEFLKNTGFLRELSDATSIVENPYSEVEE